MKKYIVLTFISLFISLHNELPAQNLDNLVLEPGFKISIFAENLSSPRQIAQGKNGTIFVGERTGQIIALTDTDQNGQADEKKLSQKV